MEQTPKYNSDIMTAFNTVMTFLLKNALGIMASIFGITYTYNQMAGKFKRMSRVECITSFMLAILTAFITVIMLADSALPRIVYGIICMVAPFVSKPIADVISSKATPTMIAVMDGVIDFVKSWFKSKEKK